ncbi:hypothetical protein Pcinc_029398 [Petrolisthes cinctipes]|uniref:Uncharacterized protein n=1 Tax=Petrolisthes cinctipes TaxID=88211 RepID=A0AAE1K403_PETCI|nr:hypothetical protein Pcinc_029398 [Petrolisthes cinctipes]
MSELNPQSVAVLVVVVATTALAFPSDPYHQPQSYKGVNYEADHYKGFVADVQYYGEAQYPHQYGPPVTFKPQYGGGYH